MVVSVSLVSFLDSNTEWRTCCSTLGYLKKILSVHCSSTCLSVEQRSTPIQLHSCTGCQLTNLWKYRVTWCSSNKLQRSYSRITKEQIHQYSYHDYCRLKLTPQIHDAARYLIWRRILLHLFDSLEKPTNIAKCSVYSDCEARSIDRYSCDMGIVHFLVAEMLSAWGRVETSAVSIFWNRK